MLGATPAGAEEHAGVTAGSAGAALTTTEDSAASPTGAAGATGGTQGKRPGVTTVTGSAAGGQS